MSSYTYEIIIIVSSLIIISYLYNVISHRIKIPAVFLLISTGIIFKYLSPNVILNSDLIKATVTIFGVSGLILIVLEATLDLKLGQDKIPLIWSAFWSATIILFISGASIALVIHFWLNEPIKKCILYAIPFSIISSAIVIPSTANLSEKTREFIIYESSFSDILGIIMFNYFSSKNDISLFSLSMFGGNILIAFVISILSSLLLFYTISKTQTHVKFFLLLAILFLTYSIGKIFHQPALILIMTFGLLINNLNLLPEKILKHLHFEQSINTLNQLKGITAESAFLIRTFFFVIFGYSIDLSSLLNFNVISIGILITVILVCSRYIYFHFFVKSQMYPGLFLMPRGLITILLFYAIPDSYKINFFSEGILLSVIVFSGLLMIAGLILYKAPPDTEGV